MFNIIYIGAPTSYWAIIMPLFLSVDMLNDSFIRQAQENVNRIVYKETSKKRYDEAKASGDFFNLVLLDLYKRLAAGEKNSRREIGAPAGFDALSPRVYAEKSSGAVAATLVTTFTIPGATPAQVFTFNNLYVRRASEAGRVYPPPCGQNKAPAPHPLPLRSQVLSRG
jgi:hypothetical protein